MNWWEEGMHYKANLTAGALLVYESRSIADLLLQGLSKDDWKREIEEKNILQQKSISSAKRIASYIKTRLELMNSDLWRLIKNGDSETAIHACFAAVIKHSRLLGDYLDLVVRKQFANMDNKLTPRLWDEYILGCKQRDASMDDFPTTTAKKVRSNIHKILVEACYLREGREWILKKVDIAYDVMEYLRQNQEDYVLSCIQVSK